MNFVRIKTFPLRCPRSITTVWVGVIAILVISALPAFSATWTVTSTGDDPSDATTLRGALAVASDGDTIDLTGLTGTITLTYGTVPVERQLFVSPNVTITGPGASTLAISANNFSRVFDIGAGVSVTISGLTIKDGTADFGGAIRNTGILTLTNATLSGNTATESGGAIYNFPGKTLIVTSCTLSNNSAHSGGGIFNDEHSGTITVSDSTLSGNTALVGSGIYNYGGTLTVTNSTLSSNVAGSSDVLGSGAGIFNDSFYGYVASTTVINSTFSNNTIVSPSPGGTQGGSAITNFSGETTVTGSAFSGNTGNSGSLWNDGTLVVSNSTFTDNDTVILNQLTASFINSTLAGNGTADSFADTGGILNGENGTLTLKNTILANSPKGNCYNAGTITSQDHNISDDTTCAIFLIQPNDFAPHTSPGLDGGGLKDNGGPTKTIALVPGSVAVDAISNSADCTVNTDQRGVTRPQGTYCDIGAYEAKPDFYFSPISAISANVGSSATANVQVNSFVGFNSAVTLTTSGLPTDFSTSFSPNPLTPASYGSATSTLTVSLQPSVTPGTYGFTVTGTSGALTHSTTATVNVQASISGTITVIGTDQTLGCIDNSGISGALQSKLNAALADIAAGKIQEAINTLKALLNQLQAQAGKHISTSCKDGSGNAFDPDAVLVADVKAILASLGVNLAADPIMGNVVNSSGVGIPGATINLFNSSKSIVFSTTADVTGFYYFAATGGLSSGANYTTKVVATKPYKSSTPSAQTFIWKASSVLLKNFVLN